MVADVVGVVEVMVVRGITSVGNPGRVVITLMGELIRPPEVCTRPAQVQRNDNANYKSVLSLPMVL